MHARHRKNAERQPHAACRWALLPQDRLPCSCSNSSLYTKGSHGF